MNNDTSLNMDMLNVWLDRSISLRVPETITLPDGRTFSTEELYKQCYEVVNNMTPEHSREILVNKFATIGKPDHDYEKLAKIIQPRSETHLILKGYRGKRRFRYSLIVKPYDYPGANRSWDLSWIPFPFVMYQHAGCWVIRLGARAEQEWLIANDRQGMFLAASLPNPYKNPGQDKGLRNNNMPKWAELST